MFKRFFKEDEEDEIDQFGHHDENEQIGTFLV